MKLKNGLSLQNMGDEFVVVADRPEVFRGMIKLNTSGAFIFHLLQSEISLEKIVNRIVEKYDVDKNTAESDLLAFIEPFKTAGLIENE